MSDFHPAVLAALNGNEPTPEQWDAISYGRGPVSIVAGAGSGKTAVMAARIAYIVSGGWVRPSSILGLTFTNKAAAELESRIRTALLEVDLPQGEEVAVHTYHAFADRLIRDYGPKIGVEPEVALLSDAQAYLLVERLLQEMTFEKLKVNWIPTIIGHVRALADACSNHLLDPERVIEADAALLAAYSREGKDAQKDVRDVLEGRPEIARAVRAYIERKKSLGRIDYGDQVSLACRILGTHPEVARSFLERWPVVLLDEYQDTNVAQRKMLEHVYGPGSALTVVGDPDQAIYGWRGATLHNILNFPKHFPTKDGVPSAMLALEQSFRCGARILDAANVLIRGIAPERRGMEKVLQPFEKRGEGEVTADLVVSDTVEAELIAEEIKAIAGGEGTGIDGAPVPWKEVAILCRSKRLFGKLLHSLKERDVPVEVVGLAGLLETPEVNDLLAHMKVVAQPGENVPFARVAMGPRWRIHFRDMAALARWAARNTNIYKERLQELEGGDEIDPGEQRFYLYEALGRLDEVEELSDEARSRLSRMHDEVEALRVEMRGLSLAEAIEKVLDTSGLENELLAAGTETARAARANIAAFLDAAAAFSPLEGEVSMNTFLDYLDAARNVEDMEVAQPRDDDTVKLMTVHQAKGLEFDVVYIPGLVDRIFPNKRTTNPYKSMGQLPFEVREDSDYLPDFTESKNLSKFHSQLQALEEEEERRLAYVAITRARRAVHLSAAHWYGATSYERKFPAKIGAFFAELGGRHEDEKNAARDAIPSVTRRRFEDCPDENPLLDELALRSSAWPPEIETGGDDLFDDGWRAEVDRAISAGGDLGDVVSTSGVSQSDFESERAKVVEQLRLATAEPVEEVDDRLTSLSVSSLVQLAKCPKQFYWTTVRPLPRKPSRAARLGQEIHRWIEIRSIGQQRLGDPEEFPDLVPEETQEGRGGAKLSSLGDLKKRWEASRFSEVRPRFTEQAFVVALPGDYLVRGRIDAVYVSDDDEWEIVDFKSGGKPDAADPTSRLQLAIYALAAQRVWGVDPAKIRVTYFYLRDAAEVTYSASELDIDEGDLVALFEEVDAARFEPRPSGLCFSCDFQRFCETGMKYVEAQPSEEGIEESAETAGSAVPGGG
ncbi:MAG: ATP-dependent DNA helicase [Actinomycetota bacterium]